MDWKKIVIAGIGGGIWILVAIFLFGAVANAVAPYNIFEIGGMRSIDDPVMALYFVYPFVMSFMAAIVYDLIRTSLKGNSLYKGVMFGIILILIITIPNQFVIFSSMTYPAGFFIENILFGLIGFPVLGVLFTKIWEMK